VTVWSAPAAAAIVFGLALSPIVGAAPSVAAAGQAAPITVTMVVALTAPERDTGFIDTALLENYTSEFGILTRELDQVIDRPVVLGIDPSIIASIRILGSSAPASAIAWLERLEAATNETFPLTWADADLTIGVQAGSTELLVPESFDFAIDPSLFAAAPDEEPTDTPEPTATPPADDDGPPPLPTSESLVAWDYTIPSLAWPAMNSVAKPDFSLLARSYDATLLSTGNVSGAGHVALGEVKGNPVLLNDESLSVAFGTAVTASGAEWNASVAALTTSLAAVPSTTSAPASVVLALDRDNAVSDPDLGRTIDAIAVTPGVQLDSLANQLEREAVPVELVERTHEENAVASVAQLLKAEAADRAFATIAAQPGFVTSERRLNLLVTISNAWHDNTTGWSVARTTFKDASLELRDSVKIVKSSSITLWADRASLPVTVSNALLDQAITVYVSVRPQTPLLKVENNFVAVTVEPGSQRKAQIPVQSLSNGTVALDVALYGPTGVPIGVPHLVRTTVQAGWETPFTVGFAILLVVIFAVGITRTILRRRAARRSEA
jgi:hypothetical protein